MSSADQPVDPTFSAVRVANFWHHGLWTRWPSGQVVELPRSSDPHAISRFIDRELSREPS